MPTRWGVLSTGGIANDFSLALSKTDGAVLHACASRSQSSADAFAATHGFSKAYASYEALAADAEVDVVYVATPHAFHCENILMLLEAGKHVLCEKPMVVTAAQAERCIAKAREKRRFLMEGMWTRFFPTTRAVRKLVADGAIGKVVSMTASLGFKSEPSFNPRLFRPELAGGALFDVGIYPSLWISMILGVPREVSAHATMTTSFERQPVKPHCISNEVVIVGETGLIRVTRPVQAPDTYTLVTRQGDAPDPLLQRGVSTTVVTPLDPPNIGNAPGYNFVGSQGFVHEAAAVQEAISKGLLEHPEMPLDETLAMARVFEKIRAQIGLTYPWDEEGEGAAKKARR